jgi:hypothetical protein
MPEIKTEGIKMYDTVPTVIGFAVRVLADFLTKSHPHKVILKNISAGLVI